jgi:hypothetical protein
MIKQRAKFIGAKPEGLQNTTNTASIARLKENNPTTRQKVIGSQKNNPGTDPLE